MKQRRKNWQLRAPVPAIVTPVVDGGRAAGSDRREEHGAGPNGTGCLSPCRFRQRAQPSTDSSCHMGQ